MEETKEIDNIEESDEIKEEQFNDVQEQEVPYNEADDQVSQIEPQNNEQPVSNITEVDENQIQPPSSVQDQAMVVQPEEKKKSKKRKRLARKQAKEEDVFDDKPHVGTYNIWWDRVQDYSTWRDRREAKLAGKRFKLDTDRDSGETQAPTNAYVCLYFARGKCVHGSTCKFKHRIPNRDDEDRIDVFHDVFGRERHRTEREDMGGIGSFNRDNRTLYVGGIRMVNNIDDIVKKHFGKFGKITNLRLLPGRSIAFVTYDLRVSAEFAKEAMSDQTLVGNEVMNVRWANEDPNPQAQSEKTDKERIEAWQQLCQQHPEYFDQIDHLSNQQYPDTDHQYGGSSSSDNNQVPTSAEEIRSIYSSSTSSVEYEAWQTWYAQQGYPGYYDSVGRYHYYDPSLYTTQQIISLEKGGAEAEQAYMTTQYQQQSNNPYNNNNNKITGQTTTTTSNATTTTSSSSTDDYYNYYASYPAPQDSNYFQHFENYDQDKEEGTSSEPLYPAKSS
eukprot:TRINITY_DN768_c1_g1_i1.p1 TRINITY_DN768_c1_g1~~TRINITY_DN768_c1_g1_i1.p1  ORF type:complete len:510 (+),score=161.00 TRINITY_DN768_c1_g1_i1:33-1532(+)